MDTELKPAATHVVTTRVAVSFLTFETKYLPGQLGA